MYRGGNLIIAATLPAPVTNNAVDWYNSRTIFSRHRDSSSEN